MNSLLRRLLVLLLAAFGASAFAADWWNMPEPDFVKQYGNLATGTPAQQSQFAWMLFARVNQRVQYQGTSFSQWEMWPSDSDTFSPDAPRFNPQNKTRTRPHLQESKLVRAVRATAHVAVNPFPSAGEEVTRNVLSYGYITGKSLNTQAGIVKYLAGPGAKIDFPIGAVEIKATWAQGALPGAYQVGGFSLTGLHIMMKFAPRPANPFTDDTPSWFWTTFEYKQNPGLAAAQKFITYGDAATPAQITQWLTQAGLNTTAFVNYASNGTQIQYYDAKNAKIVLGNTQMEWPFATPQNQNPTTWTSWSSSCHSCHGQASGQPSGQTVNFFGFTAPVGKLTGAALPPGGYQALDFVWALANAQ